MARLGIDIGGTKIAAGVVDDAGRIVQRARRSTPTTNPADIDRTIADLYRELSPAADIRQVGLAAAGFVSSDRSTVLTAPNLPWRRYPLGEQVAALLPSGIDVVVENDANAAAWGEHPHGAGEPAGVSLMITVGTGIGGGIVSNGELQRGAFGAAAEVGHLTVVQDGRRCGCGKLGCWEAYGSGTALLDVANRELEGARADGRALRARRDADGGVLTGQHIADAASAGDPLASRLFAETAEWIGRGLASLTAILDPEVIVVGGGVADSEDLLIPGVRTAYASRVSGSEDRPAAQIVAASLGNDAGLIGAAALARTSRTGGLAASAGAGAGAI
ncbi:ROK family glucokinase [Microbacterium sp. YMB-B2]|uniref:Glucokinase n=1 Tax=Microbacterium tenebrionis TaxID=2830665 RepID=A0A9X1RZL2_9MICO|nr:ROK family glucokinase [Microbacterium tenebrionis]MCC2028874.1 ROK family glucokinase [Microbacterium tenebrionis]